MLDKQEVVKKLGEGAFGTVQLCEVINSEYKVAVKVIDIKDASKNNVSIKDIETEIEVLKELDSPQVMKYIDCEVRDNKYFIVCEYIKGQELISLLEQYGPMSENKAKKIFYFILLGVSHIHNINVLHRDLKLENIFVRFKSNKVNFNEIDEIKIVDLGFGKKIWTPTSGFQGTPNYMPPEVFKGEYQDFKFDSFSLGVILYVMILCDFPFNGNDVKSISHEVKNSKPNFNYPEFKEVSPACIDLIKKMLEKDKNSRLSVTEALKHEWFNGVSKIINDYKDEKELNKKAISSFSDYTKRSKFYKAIKILISKINTTDSSSKQQRDMFIKQDVDNSGQLDRVEFTELFGNLSKDVVSDMDAMKLFDLIDVNGDEKIEFDEFMAIFKETTSTNDMILIEYMFKCIDKDNSGTIETEEIKKFVEDNKVVFSKDELNKLVARIDADNSGSVDINEFKQALFEEFKKLEY